jgi:ABC-type Fe3+-hydroxamate transport system substrate-binding protein
MPSIEVIDPTGHRVVLSEPAKRIVSLVPSQTELLADLGLNSEVVGITRFCVHPKGWMKEKTKVGGTKNVNPKRVKSLQPDLILANKEENVKEQVEALREICPVWTSDVKSVEDATDLISDFGILTGRMSEADKLRRKVLDQLDHFPPVNSRKTGLYLIWKDPWMAAGGDTFIHQMMDLAGLDNILENEVRYPQMDLSNLDHKPQVVLLSSEPYPFGEEHISEMKKLIPEANVLLVDGEMFSWYGSRMQYAIPYLHELSKQWSAF